MKHIAATIILAVSIAAVTIHSLRKENSSPLTGSDITGSYRMTGLSIITPAGEVSYMPSTRAVRDKELLTIKPDSTYSYFGSGLHSTTAGNKTGVWEYKGKDSLMLNGFPVSIVSKTNSQLVLLADRSEDGIGLVFKTTYRKV